MLSFHKLVRRRIVIASVLVICSAIIAASAAVAARSSSSDVTIQFWTFPYANLTQNQIQAIVDNFNRTHPGITVQQTNIQFSDGRTKIQLAMASGDGPDVFEMSPTDYSYMKAGVVASATQLGFKQKYLNTLLPIYKTAEWNGTLYAIPSEWFTNLLYVNQTLLAKYGFKNPPTTWDQLYSMASTITKESTAQGQTVYGFALDGMDSHLNAINHTWTSFLTGAGGNSMNADLTKSTENTPQGLAALQYLRKFYANGVSKVGVSAEQGFMSGQVAMFSFTQGEGSVIAASNLKDKWIAVPLPNGPAGMGQYTTGNAFAANAKSKNLAADGIFIRYMTSAALTAHYMSKGSLSPYKQSSLSKTVQKQIQKDIAAEPWLKAGLASLALAKLPPIRSEYAATAARWAAQKNYIVAAISGQISPQSALQSVDAAVDQSLK